MLRLSGAWQAHEGDVKALTPGTAPGSLFSVSRDGSVALWQPVDGTYQLGFRHHEHGGYVNSVAILNDDEDDLVLSGGQNGVVYAWSVADQALAYALIGHTDNVCAIHVQEGGLVWTGSWDGTVRGWRGAECIARLGELEDGDKRSAAVWAICSLQGLLVTGSADGRVRWWNPDTQANDHQTALSQAAIRAIRPMPLDGNLAILDNEGQVFIVRDYKVIANWHCHELAYAMDVAMIELSDSKGKGKEGTNHVVMATAGEDRMVKLWQAQTGELLQSLPIPSVSAWSVRWLHGWRQEAPLLAVGCSNGLILLFGLEPADPTSQALYDEALKAAVISGHVVDPNLLSPESILQQPGEIGRNYLIERNHVVEAHQWDGHQWVMLGTVVDKQEKKKKQLYEGKEYDYVFEVDVNGAMLKLPYNQGDNAWQAAQTFILRHGLDPSFQDQVVDFILTNTDAKNQTAMPSKQHYVRYGQGNLEGIKRKLNDPRLDPLFARLTSTASTIPIDYGALLQHQTPLFPLLDLIRLTMVMRPEIGREMLVRLPIGQWLGRVESSADLTMALRLLANVAPLDADFCQRHVEQAMILIQRGYADGGQKDPLLASSCLFNLWLATRNQGLVSVAKERARSTLNQEELRLLNNIQ